MTEHNAAMDNKQAAISWGEVHGENVASATPVVVRNSEFLKAVFRKNWKQAHVCGFREDPGSLDTKDPVTGESKRHYWAGAKVGGAKVKQMKALLADPENNLYFTISTFNDLDPDQLEDGKTWVEVRRKAQHHATFVIVIDDVGSEQAITLGWGIKVPWSRVMLEPSYVLETSPGNYQVGVYPDRA